MGGETVSKIFAKFPPNTATTPIYNRDGLTIDAGCGSGGAPVLTLPGSPAPSISLVATTTALGRCPTPTPTGKS